MPFAAKNIFPTSAILDAFATSATFDAFATSAPFANPTNYLTSRTKNSTKNPSRREQKIRINNE